jgi:hypothetical protein
MCNLISIKFVCRLVKRRDVRVSFCGFRLHNAADLYSSVWRGSSVPLLVLHTITLAIVIFTILFELLGPPHLAPSHFYEHYFAYLTNWTWYLLGIRAALGIVFCLRAIRRRRHHPEASEAEGSRAEHRNQQNQNHNCRDLPQPQSEQGTPWQAIEPAGPQQPPAEQAPESHLRTVEKPFGPQQAPAESAPDSQSRASSRTDPAQVQNNLPERTRFRTEPAHASQSRSDNSLPLQPGFQPYGPLDKTFAVLGTILPTASILVTVGYWAAVRNNSTDDLVFVDEPIKHGGNAILTLLELMISRIPMVTTWAAWPVWYMSVYAIFQVIYEAIGEEWVYERTDYTECTVLPAYILLPIVTLVIYTALCDSRCLHNVALVIIEPLGPDACGSNA